MEFGGPIRLYRADRGGLVCVYITRSVEPVRTVSIQLRCVGSLSDSTSVVPRLDCDW